MLKNLTRLVHWIKLFLQKSYLKNVHSIIEVGTGKSRRIQTVLTLLLYKGSYKSIDLIPVKPIKSRWLLFKPEAIQINFFNYSDTADLVIFDHAIDDLLAEMLDDHATQKSYDQLMDNTKLFNYENPVFINDMLKILAHAKTLLSPNGRIVISNYLTAYDYVRGTVDITKELLPQLVKLANQAGLGVDVISDRFLVLGNSYGK
jgi:hypothetical protein